MIILSVVSGLMIFVWCWVCVYVLLGRVVMFCVVIGGVFDVMFKFCFGVYEY